MAQGSARSKHPKRLRRRLVVERLDQRRVLAAIAGSVFEDLNLSAQREVGEPVAPRRLIYIDANDNAALDTGEKFTVGELDGSFRFDGLTDGDYRLRLFNGTSTQSQTTPLDANVVGSTVTLIGGTQVLAAADSAVALTNFSVVLADSSTGQSQSLSLGNELTRMQSLPDGRLLVVGSDSNGPTSWIVDLDSAAGAPVSLAGGGSTPWSELAIDGDGRGVLLDQAVGQSLVRSIQPSDSGIGITTEATNSTVPTDTQVLTSHTGSRSVFAWNGANGLQASLWSNVTSSFITDSPTELSGTTGLLSFDDASGLLAARSTGGGVRLFDANANFALLHSFNDVTGPVVIDGLREQLLTISPIDSALRLINLRNGDLIADLALDLSSIGNAASIALDQQSDSIAVLGAAGIAELALNRSAAVDVTIRDGEDVDSILFGVALDGSNVPPQYQQLPNLQTNEDSSLVLPAPGALVGSFDANSDHYVLVQLTSTSNGTVTARLDGSLQYTPLPDFNGTDRFEVLLHDGRDASDPIELSITVLPVPDDPEDLVINIPPIPELVIDGAPVGTVEIIDADGGGHTVVINDQRFDVRGPNIIFVGGEIDFDKEPLINLTISVTDPETGEIIEETVSATVQEDGVPIVDITPHAAEVTENTPGQTVARLQAETRQPFTLAINDDRFELVGQTLKLKDGVALDFEAEQTVPVSVTATGQVTGETFTRAIIITVLDVPEPITTINLSNQTVLELHPGDVVGDVLVDGFTPQSYHRLSVNDPRFEIEDGSLKLLDGETVERAAQSQIELTVSVELVDNVYEGASEDFVIEVLENSTPFHNHENPYDVNHSGRVTALDAVVIVNFLNRFGPGPVGRANGNNHFCYDVNADALVTALDALLVLNELARQENGGGTVGGEATGSGTPPKAGSSPEGELIPDDIPTTEPRNQAGNFDDGNDDPSSISTVDLDGDETSSDEYAQSVDETLRLLSDD